MKPTETLARAKAPDGCSLVLSRRDGEYLLSLDGLTLMASRQRGSEQVLARRAASALAGRASPRVLVGGLGFGYTLRAALDALPAGASLVLCELFAFLLEAHRGEVGELAGRPLEDPRVTAVNADVASLLGGPERFDAILLDVDNGPWAFTMPANEQLYSPAGLARIERSLSPGGLLGVWSAEPSPEFEKRLRKAGFKVRSERVESRSGAPGGRHTLFFATPSRAPSV